MKTDLVQSLTTTSELIRNKGDQALFSKSTKAMKAQWKVPDARPLADFTPTIILKAKDFATEITIFNAREHKMSTEAAIPREHITNNSRGSERRCRARHPARDLTCGGRREEGRAPSRF